MNIKLQEELDSLANKYKRISDFSKRLPLFKDTIIDNKIDPPENYRATRKIVERYKKMPFNWGICVGKYNNDNKPTNCALDIDDDVELISFYINRINLFSDNASVLAFAATGLNEIVKECKPFYFDCLNTTFYLTTCELEGVLDKVVTWYEVVRDKSTELHNQDRIKKLKDELEKLQES